MSLLRLDNYCSSSFLSAPATCTDGQFYDDKCDMKLYYQCAHGIPYPHQCNSGTVWDISISNCNWDYAVPIRAPPTGSDCTGSVSTTPLQSHTTTKSTTQNTAHTGFPNTNSQPSTSNVLSTTVTSQHSTRTVASSTGSTSCGGIVINLCTEMGVDYYIYTIFALKLSSENNLSTHIMPPTELQCFP